MEAQPEIDPDEADISITATVLRPAGQEAASGDPDVLLDVPNLSVDEISLEVENLKARVSLDARLANLLQLTAGADVGIDSVKLTIAGVQAEVLLKVRRIPARSARSPTSTSSARRPMPRGRPCAPCATPPAP